MTPKLHDFLTRVAALPTHQDCPVDNHWLVVEAMELLGNPETKVPVLGTLSATPRGFPLVAWTDDHDCPCDVSCSSVIGDYEDAFERPGTSALWIGVTDARPMVMWKDAAAVGVKTNMKCGWVPYPVPPEVLLRTRMHLDREHVRGLIGRLEEWLATGTFDGAPTP